MAKWILWPAAFLIFSLLLFTITACTSSAPVTPERVEHKDEHEHGEEEAEHEHEMPALSPASLGTGERLRAVATTSIVADVVENVGGDRVELTRLMPLGVDPHAFEPRPQDVAAVSEAHVIFANGLGLEAFLEPLLENADAADRIVYVSHGVPALQAEAEHTHEDEEVHEHEGTDPHSWTDPNNVIVWTRNIADALGALDPDNAASYRANAEAYVARLEELDRWVREQVAQVPEQNRKLVTDHALFAHFAERYSFTQVGAIVPGYSTAAQPSAKELAELEDAIRELEVKAVFVGDSVNPSLAERVAQDTGTELVRLYTGSLSGPDGPASSYIDYVRYNVNAIVGALR